MDFKLDIADRRLLLLVIVILLMMASYSLGYFLKGECICTPIIYNCSG